MQRVPRPCSQCGARVMRSGLCARHYKQQDARRGSANQRGYDAAHRVFRTAVLERDKYLCPCGKPATVADHYPLSRKALVEQSLDPNDPQYGRALCKSCHDRHTALTQSHLGNG